MKNFDHRWNYVAERARHAERREENAPFGFAAQVVARSCHTPHPPADPTWDRLIGRFLLAATTALVLCAAMEWRHLHNPRPLDPGIENSIAQLVWTL